MTGVLDPMQQQGNPLDDLADIFGMGAVQPSPIPGLGGVSEGQPVLEREYIDESDDDYDEPYDAPIHPDIAKAHHPKLDKEIQAEVGTEDRQVKVLNALGKRVCGYLEIGKKEREPLDAVVREARRAVDSQPEGAGPLGEYGVNLHTPMTWVARQVLHGFIHEVTTGVRPYGKVEPWPVPDEDPNAGPKWEGAAQKIEDLMDAFYTEKMIWRAFQDEIIGATLDDGTAFGYPYWRHEVRRDRGWRKLSLNNAKSLGFNVPTNEAYMMEGKPLTRKDGGKKASIGDWVRASGETVTKHHPDVGCIHYEDYVQYPARAKSPDAAILKGHRFYKTVDDIEHGVKDRLYDREAVDRLIAAKPNPIDFNSTVTNLNQRTEADEPDERDRDDFDQSGSSYTLDDHGLLELYQVIYRFIYRVGGKNSHKEEEIGEDWLFVVETSTKTVIRAIPYPYDHGLPCYIPYRAFERPGKLYGLPIGKILRDLQKQHNAIVNQGLDLGAASLILLVEEERQHRGNLIGDDLRPGINHRIVDKAGQIALHNFSLPTQQALSDAALVTDQAERATAASEAVQGVVSKSDTTATEATQALQQGSRRLKVNASRIQEANTAVMFQCLENCRQYLIDLLPVNDNGQPQTSYAYALTKPVGTRIYGKITYEELQTPVRIFAQGDTTNTNEELRAQMMEKRWLASQNSQFTQSDPVKVWHMEAELHRTMGAQYPESIIGTQQEAMKKRDEAEKAKQTELTPPPEKLTPESMAIWLAENQEKPKAQAVLQMYQIIMQAAGKGPDDGAGEQAKAEAEVQKTQVDLQAKQAEAELKTAQGQQLLTQREQEHQLKLAQQQQELQFQRQKQAMELEHAENMAKLQVQTAREMAKFQKQDAAKKPASSGGGRD